MDIGNIKDFIDILLCVLESCFGCLGNGANGVPVGGLEPAHLL